MTGTSRARADAYNHNGQIIGSKGQRTRKLLIDTTVRLLETHGLRDLSVVDVAREAGTSPATFYVYFRGVPEVVLAALETAQHNSPELEAILQRDWQAPGMEAELQRFVDLYTELWNRHRTIFRVRNLAAEEGDERFYQVRAISALPLVDGLARHAERGQSVGRVPEHLDPRAIAGAIMMLLERLAAIGPVSEDLGGMRYDPLKEAAAYSIARMIGAGR